VAKIHFKNPSSNSADKLILHLSPYLSSFHEVNTAEKESENTAFISAF